MRTIIISAAIIFSLSVTSVYAQDHLPYIHGGKSDDDGSAFGIGYIYQGFRHEGFQHAALGFEVSKEGEIPDRTNNDTDPAVSINLIAGINIYKTDSLRLTPFAIIGAIKTETYCPAGRSLLGFECFADTDKKSKWKENLGGGLLVQFNRFAIGARATGESKSVILGWAF